MSTRARRGLLVGVGVGAIVLAACAPVAPAPPPPPAPRCQEAAGAAIPGQWVATVDPDGAAPPEVVPFEAATNASKVAEVNQLDRDGTVLTVEPDRVVKALDVVAPNNDPLYPTTQALALNEGGFPAAWTSGFGGQGVTIAIVDSGVQASHEDLASNVLQGADLVAGSTVSPQGITNFGRVDSYKHGTHVAGIAAAADNGVGGIGGAPLAKILPVRVLDSCGSGSFGDVALGIQWATDHGANVITLSLGGPGSCSPLQASIDDAWSKGVLVVAAAGNNSSSTPIFPAGCDHVLAVGATALTPTSPAVRASYSNYGSFVGIAAPGTSIYSTVIPGPNTYGPMSGTSMATPFVSAAAALVYEHCLAPLSPPTSATADRVRDILTSSEGFTVTPWAVRVDATGGTFTLTFDGQTTSALPFNASGAAVTSALEALSNVGTGNVAVTTGQSLTGLQYAVQFKGAVVATPVAVSADGSALTGGFVTSSGPLNAPLLAVDASGGTFTLTFNGQTTSPLPFNASAVAVQSALQALPLIGPNATVTGGPGGPFGTDRYLITFTGALAANTTLITADTTSLVGSASFTANPTPLPGRLDAGAAIVASCI